MSALRRIKLLGDFHRFLYLVQQIDVGCVGADVAEKEFGGLFAKF